MIDSGGGKFVIIGAMKAGTTTLYNLLRGNREIFLPDNKEPNLLFELFCSEDKFFTRCNRLYSPGSDSVVVGEASTSYAKFPFSTGVPLLAKKYYGEDLKIIYILREPKARVLSELNHYIAIDQTESALRGRLAQTYYNSSYFKQHEKWLEVFPSSSILLINFEQMISDLQLVLDKVTDFLGVSRMDCPQEVAISNSTRDKRHTTNAVLSRIIKGEVYLDLLKPKLGSSIRSLAKNVLMRKNRVCTDIEMKYFDEKLYLTVVGQRDVRLWESSKL